MANGNLFDDIIPAGMGSGNDPKPDLIPAQGDVPIAPMASAPTEQPPSFSMKGLKPVANRKATPVNMDSPIVPKEEYKVKEPNMWDKVWGAFIESPGKAIGEAVEAYESYVQDPMFGFFLGNDETRALQKRLKDEGTNTWLAWGEAFDQSEQFSEGEKMALRILGDPLNFVGWGILGKVPKAGRFLGKIDDSFNYFSDVVVDGLKWTIKAPVVGARRVGVKTGVSKFSLVPPSVTRHTQAFRAYYEGHGIVRTAVNNQARDNKAFIYGGKERTASVLKTMAEHKNFSKAPTVLRDLNELITVGSLPVMDTMKKHNALLTASDVTGRRVEEIVVDIYDELSKRASGVRGNMTNEQTQGRIYNLLGANDNKYAEKYAKSLTENTMKRRETFMNAVVKRGLTPKQFAHEAGLRYANAMGDVAVAQRMKHVQGMWGSLLNKADWVESNIMRKALDDFWSKPFAQSYLSFGFYGPMNIVEEGFRSLLSTRHVGAATSEEVIERVGDLPNVKEFLVIGETRATMPSELGVHAGDLSKPGGIELLKDAEENRIRIDGAIRGLSDSVIERRVEKALRAVDKNAPGLIELPALKIGKAESLKGLGESLRKAAGGRNIPYLDRMGNYPLFRFKPFSDPQRAGKFMLEPTGFIGDVMGHGSILMSQYTQKMKNSAFLRLYDDALEDLILRTEDEFLAVRKQYVGGLNGHLTGLKGDPIITGSEIFAKEMQSLNAGLRQIALTPEGDLMAVFNRTVNAQGIQRRRFEEILGKYGELTHFPEFKVELRNLYDAGASWEDMAKWVETEGIDIIYSNIARHPAYITKRLEDFGDMFVKAANDAATPEDLVGMMSNFHTTVYTSAMLPSEVRRAVARQASYVGDENMDALWRMTDDSLDEYVFAMEEAVDKMATALERVGKAQGVSHIRGPVDTARAMVENTRKAWEEANAFRRSHFARKKDFTSDAFWSEYRQRMDDIWIKQGNDQAALTGELVGKLSRLTGDLRNLPSQAPIPMGVRGRPRNISMEELSKRMGGSSNELRRALVENLALLDEDNFTQYVMTYLRETGQMKGVNEKVIRRIHKQLSGERGGMTTIAGPKEIEATNLASDLRGVPITNVYNEKAIEAARQRVQNMQTFVDGKRAADPKLFENFKEMRIQAVDIANKELEKNFVMYDNPTALNSFMRHFFPFWTYEASRPEWLARMSIRHPWIPTQTGRFYDMDEEIGISGGGYGYLQIAKELQIMPLRGTIFGMTATLTKPDYPAVMSGPFFEAIDDMQRYGFYLGAPGQSVLAMTRIIQGGPAETGSIIPPLQETGLNVLIAAGSTHARDLHEKLFPNKFRDYNINQWLESHHGIRLFDLEAELEELNGIDLGDVSPEKAAEIETRKSELNNIRDDAYRQVAKYDVIGTQTGMTHMRHEDRVEAENARASMWVDIVGSRIGKDEDYYRNLLKYGNDPWAMHSNEITPDMWAIINESWPMKYKGVASELRSQEPEATITRQQNELRRKADEWKSWRHKALTSLWTEFVSGGQLSNTVLREKIGDINTKYFAEMEKLYGKKEMVDGKLQWAIDPITGEPMYGEYGWVVEDGKYIQGIPMGWDDMVEYNEILGRVGPMAPPHPLQTYLDAYYGVNPSAYTLPDGSVDWDTVYSKKDEIEEAIPDYWREPWEEMKGRFLPEPERLAMEARNGVLRQYWNLWGDILKAYSPIDRSLISKADHSSDPRVRDALQDSDVYKGFRKKLRDARELMRTANPEVDYYLWFYGYTEKGVGGEAVPLYYNDGIHNWGKTPPGYGEYETWAPTYEDREREVLLRRAKELGVEEWLRADDEGTIPPS